MQPIIAFMTRVREAFFAALWKSFLRTKSILQTILNIWISPSLFKSENEGVAHAKFDAVENGNSRKEDGKTAEFLANVERELIGKVDVERLLRLSDGMKGQMEDSLINSQVCMLPSYNHQLPTGDETGFFLALDVGGSTFRVALLELLGRQDEKGSKIEIIKAFKINQPIKQLEGVLFFDWMAQRIKETLCGRTEGHGSKEALKMGLAWSFPIEQTSHRSGLLQGMGKGFMAAHGLLGQDLGDLLQDSCSRHGLNVQLSAIVNDSSATLLSKAYLDTTTRFSLILGTGVNAAVHLPVHVLSSSKFGIRPDEWHEKAKHVIVNTELSMFGADFLPLSKWDEQINEAHPMPGFQPLEHFVSGGYLGEIARLILIDGIKTAGLFGGVVPESLVDRYSLDSETISRIETDKSTSLTRAIETFTTRHPTSPPLSFSDIDALRTIASHVSYRGASVVAAGVHALWRLRNAAEGITAKESKHTLVAYNGSVLENYPRYHETCQKQLDLLAERSGAATTGTLELEHAEESSLLGAAIAVACMGN